LPVHRLSKASL